MGVAPTYEAWLRAQTQSVDTEVNVQLGEYTLKKNTLQPLPSHISVDGDFVSVFGVSLNANPIQCVEVEASTHRLWLRLVGQRHDVQLWDADPRHPTAPFSRPYTASARESADGDAARRKGEAYASGLADGEQWIAHVLEPFRKQYLRDVELCLPDWDHSDQSFAYLAGLVAPGADGGGGLKEVVVFRSPEVVHVYNVISHARRWYRSLIFSSDNAFCLYDMPSTLFLHGDRPRLVAGEPKAVAKAAPSLLITRSLTRQLGTQTFVPTRLLRGLIPAALLEVYAFWQDENDSLAAYPHAAAPSAAKRTRLTLQLSKFGEEDSAGSGAAQASVVLRREPINLDDDDAATADDGADSSRSSARSSKVDGVLAAAGGRRGSGTSAPKPMASTAQERHHCAPRSRRSTRAARRSHCSTCSTHRRGRHSGSSPRCSPASSTSHTFSLDAEVRRHARRLVRHRSRRVAAAPPLVHRRSSAAGLRLHCVEHAGLSVSGRDRRTLGRASCSRASLTHCSSRMRWASSACSSLRRRCRRAPRSPPPSSRPKSSSTARTRRGSSRSATRPPTCTRCTSDASASPRRRSPPASTSSSSASSTASTRPSSAQRRVASPICHCRRRSSKFSSSWARSRTTSTPTPTRAA